MRSFQLIFWILFILFYILITFGTFRALQKLAKPQIKKKLLFSILPFSLLLLVAMILLYVWPGNVRWTRNYSPYYLFNGVLILDLIFKIPLALFFFVSLFFQKIHTKKIIASIGFIISVCLGLSVLYGIVRGRNDVVVQHVELEFPTLPKAFEGYKIIQISDIHLGSFKHSKSVLRRVREEVQRNNPDLVLFTGDLVNNFSDELMGWETIFREINSSGKSFSILGNHDYGNYSNWKSSEDKTENLNAIVAGHKKLGFRLLRNENVVIHSASDSIFIVGVENWGHPPFPQYASLAEALAGIPKNAFKILLTHDPAHWESQVVGKENIALTLSGHTHGLQLGTLKAGIPFSLSILTRKNWGGLYKNNETYLYVNTGLGTVGIPWRINMPAEITVIKLKRVEVD